MRILVELIALISVVAAQFKPSVYRYEVIANITDPKLNRDSCSSVKLGSRAFWTCRDTSYKLSDGSWSFPFVNSVGWTDYNADGSPYIQPSKELGPGSTGSNNILLMKGPLPTLPAYFPLRQSDCGDAGVCGDSFRWVSWVDSPPLVTNTAEDGTITAYAWLSKTLLSGIAPVDKNLPTTLYRLTYKPEEDENIVPHVEVVDYEFWSRSQIGFGVYGSLTYKGYAYLYGKMENGTGVALARVVMDKIESKSEYEFFANGNWTKETPSLSNKVTRIVNASAGGQGTYYWSQRHNSFIWIGQAGLSVTANFFITTATKPEGPWIEPYALFKGADGDQELASYSLQAHPHMLRQEDHGIYLSWTQCFDVYVTPLVYISFT